MRKLLTHERKAFEKKRSNANWEKVKVKADSDIGISDIHELDPDFFKSAELRMPATKISITVLFDTDVLEWYGR